MDRNRKRAHSDQFADTILQIVYYNEGYIVTSVNWHCSSIQIFIDQLHNTCKKSERLHKRKIDSFDATDVYVSSIYDIF